MTDKQNLITDVKEALQKATPGPWAWENGIKERGDRRPAVIINYNPNLDEWFVHGELASKDDAHLIANSIKWLHQLVTELEEAHKEKERYKSALLNITEYPPFETTNNGDRFYEQMRKIANNALVEEGL